LTGCRQHAEAQARAQYARIERLLHDGQLDSAWANTDKAMREHHSAAWASRFRLEAARIREIQGQNDEVIRLLNHDWTSTSNPDFQAQRLCLLSLAYSRIGDSVHARKAMAEADQLNRISPSTKAEIFARHAIFEIQENHLTEAESLLRQSLATARIAKDAFAEATALLNLSAVDLQQDRYEDAIEQSDIAAHIAQTIGAQVVHTRAVGNAGWAYYETGDYQRALANFKAAAANAANLGSTSDEEHWNNTAGMSEARMGNYAAARKHYNRAMALARTLKDPSEIAQVDQSLASLALHSPHPEQAAPYIKEARALAQQMASAFDIQLGDLLQAQFLTSQGNISQAKSLLLQVEAQTLQFPTIQLDAEHTLTDVMEKAGDTHAAETWYQRSTATYHSQRDQLQTDDARLPFFANGRDLYLDYAAFLIRNHRTDDALAVIDQGRAETLAEGLGIESKKASTRPRKLSLSALARQANADILVYALSPQGSYLWAANGKQSGFYQLPDRAQILDEIANHRRAVLAARDLLKAQDPSAHKLYDMLVKPAEHLIHPGDRVYIVADDGMHGLNFETLLTPGGAGHYWIEDVTITNLASVRLLVPARRPPSSHKSSAPQDRLLVIGNPVYSGQQYAPLPNAAAEVTNVAAHFPANDRTVLTGADASPDAYVKSDPSRFDYIHFVSHAVASELVPLDSAVILSPHGTPDSAKLYARDILSKPLHANLVTISACQGSGVRAYAGEGLVGLAWAFLRAGSRNVIGALWDVSDASTPELMQHLYDGIADGQPPDVSLRAAKLQMLHSHGIFRKPIYWSAFQLYSAGS
jgi:CHAT domain-containing protein